MMVAVYVSIAQLRRHDMLTLIARQVNPRNSKNGFIVEVQGHDYVSERAFCIDDAVGALLRKHPANFSRLAQEVEMETIEDGYLASFSGLGPDTYGMGDTPDNALGAMVRLNHHIFGISIVLR
ncbi:MAG: hypothetical protein ACAH17_01720 [Candidatus Paceibacterota bacterium]